MLTFVNVNWLAILLAVVATQILGFLWYSVLFSKAWQANTPGIKGKTKAQMSGRMGPAFGSSIIGNIVMAYVLATILINTGSDNSAYDTALAGAVVGLWIAFGFIFTTSLQTTLFSWKPLKAHWIDVGYPMVSLVVMGAIIGGM